MQTPNTPRGRETERLMAIWRQLRPEANPSEYNREWDSVYRKLEGQFSDTEDRPHPGFAEAIDASETTTNYYPPTIIASSEDYVKPEPRRRRKHGPQTKGAFGKPKPYHHR